MDEPEIRTRHAVRRGAPVHGGKTLDYSRRRYRDHLHGFRFRLYRRHQFSGALFSEYICRAGRRGPSGCRVKYHDLSGVSHRAGRGQPAEREQSV